MSGFLLDTCAVLWTALDEPISSGSRTALEAAMENDLPICVSAISALEIGLLAAGGRQKFAMDPRDWFKAFLQSSGVELLPLDPDLLVGSCFLPDCSIRDPFDRIIIATARMTGLAVVTRDRALLAYSAKGHVRTVAC